MIPVTQTDTSFTTGNCFAACLASVLELPLEQVPNFMDEGTGWYDRYNDWLAGRNLRIFTYRGDLKPPTGYAILGAGSPRFNGMHAVVTHNGEIVWDPHPQSEMGVGEWIDWTLIIPLDPAKPVGIPLRDLEEQIKQQEGIIQNLIQQTMRQGAILLDVAGDLDELGKDYVRMLNEHKKMPFPRLRSWIGRLWFRQFWSMAYTLRPYILEVVKGEFVYARGEVPAYLEDYVNGTMDSPPPYRPRPLPVEGSH